MAKCLTFKDLLVAVTTGSREIEYCGPALNDYQEKVLTQFLKQLPTKVVRLAIKTSPIRDEALGEVLVQIAQRPSILAVSVNASDKIKERIELALIPKKSKTASRVGFQSPHLRSSAATSSGRQATTSSRRHVTISVQQLATTSSQQHATTLSLQRTTSLSQLQAVPTAQPANKNSLRRTTSFLYADTSSAGTLFSDNPLKQVTNTSQEQSEHDGKTQQMINQPVVDIVRLNNGEDDIINSGNKLDHTSLLTTHETLSGTDDVDDDNGFAEPPPRMPAPQRASELARVIDGLSQLLQQEIEFHEQKLQRPLSVFFAQNPQQVHEETNNTLQRLKQLQNLINDSQPSTLALLKAHCALLEKLAQDIQGSNITSIDVVQLNITLQTLLLAQNQTDKSPSPPLQQAADSHTEAELVTRPNKRPRTDAVTETKVSLGLPK